MPNLKVKVELLESEQQDVCSSTFMNPIGGDLWRGINVWTGRKHALSPTLSDSVNTLLSHITHHFTVNRHCMLPAQIKNCLCLVLPPPSSSGEHTGGIVAIPQDYILAFQTAVVQK